MVQSTPIYYIEWALLILNLGPLYVLHAPPRRYCTAWTPLAPMLNVDSPVSQPQAATFLGNHQCKNFRTPVEVAKAPMGETTLGIRRDWRLLVMPFFSNASFSMRRLLFRIT